MSRVGGVSDLYHELSHFFLFRFSAEFLDPIEAEIDAHFDQAVKDGRQKGWVAALIDQREEYRKAWKREWMVKFGADMTAAYYAGPAYGWSNVRLCSNVSADLFNGASTHPADAARASAIEVVLQRIGRGQDATDIETEWKDLVVLMAQAKPQGFDLTYPHALLEKLADSGVSACHAVGLKSHGENPAAATEVTQILNQAWQESRSSVTGFAAWEQKIVAQLKASFKLP